MARQYNPRFATPDDPAALVRPPALAPGIESLGRAVREHYISMDRGHGACVIPIETERELRLVIPHGATYRRRSHRHRMVTPPCSAGRIAPFGVGCLAAC